MILQDDADSAPKSVLEADSLLPSYLREDPAEEAAALARQLLTLLGLSQAQARQLLEQRHGEGHRGRSEQEVHELRTLEIGGVRRAGDPQEQASPTRCVKSADNP